MSQLQLEGMDQLQPRVLRECLLTRERERVEVVLSAGAPQCTEPPFDQGKPGLSLWRWPWTEWPSFNQAVLDQDLKRILRWYQARGFYDARIERTRLSPPEAESAAAGAPCQGDCKVDIHILIAEGQPVLVDSVDLSTTRALSAEVRRAVGAAITLERGERFDEAEHDRTKANLVQTLKAASFAAAEVRAKVTIDTGSRRAVVSYELVPGAAHRFGRVTLSGQGDLPAAPILAAANVPRGEPYDPANVSEVQAEVFALGAFSAVEVRETVDTRQQLVHLELKLTRLAPHQLRLGIGVTSGANRRLETGAIESIPQWDVHLFGRYERRHVLGSLGKFGVEERPRLIYGRQFPATTSPSLGNVINVRFNQPGWFEPRTDWFVQSGWDYGPDPFLGFTRSDILLRTGVRRGFFARHLIATLALQEDLFVVPGGEDNDTTDGSITPQSYSYSFVEQDLRLDLRDDPVTPSSGFYLAVNVAEAPRWAASDWSTLRLIPETRGYVPLPYDISLAARFALGLLFVGDSSPELDPISRQLGPSNYRLRGGGASSVRGFLPGQLGAGLQGGLRRWEAMVEARARLGSAFSVVGFLDFGDVNAAPAFRFEHLNTTAGFGFRYLTIVGPIRLDVGYRIRRWQRADGSEGIEPESETAPEASTLPFSARPGALHLTLGESF